MIICNNNFLRTATITPNLPSDIYKASILYSQTQYGLDGICQYTTSIVIDLGSDKKVTAIGVLNSSATITVQANTSDSWGAPAYSLNITEPIHLIDQTYRYWRIYTSAVGSQYIGQFYLGVPLEADYAQAGSVPQIQASDIENFSATGRYFASKGHDKLIQSFTVSTANQTEYDSWYNYYRSDSRTKPIIFCQYEETQGGSYPVYFGRLRFGADGREKFSYRFNFDLIEVS
jgi:hypothetical protein